MADEKPKHKPQQKHTLNEVLKSLQDLIRNDLDGKQTGEKTGRQAAKGETRSTGTASTTPTNPSTSFAAATRLTGAAGARLAGSEADSFNQALEKLDEIIHQRIIEPVERTQQAPPEPLAPEEELQIEWDDPADSQAAKRGDVRFDLAGDVRLEDLDFETAEPPASDGARGEDEMALEALQPAPESADPAGEHSETGALEGSTIEDIELTPLDVVENPAETLEPVQESYEPKATDHQGAFSFNEPAFENEPPLDRDAAHTVEEPPAPTLDETRVEPTLPPDSRLGAQEPSQPRGPQTDQGSGSFTVEYRPKPESADSEAEAETRREPKPPAAGPPASAPGAGEHAAGASKGAVPEREIPVLKEVAELDVSASPPLPEARQAREIAIRVIARLNIERRKAGDPPLDIKTIEQLQQHLAEALTKRALNKPT